MGGSEEQSRLADQRDRIKVLLVDDDQDYVFLIKDILGDANTKYDIDAVTTVSEAIGHLSGQVTDVCLCDYMLGGQTGFDLLRHSKEMSMTTPIIILTNLGDNNIDYEAMHLGATDYLPKEDISTSMLDRSIRYALERKRALEERLTLEEQLRQAQKMETIGTLAGGIAHDFNNILTPILAYTDMVRERNQQDEVTREDLSRVIEAAHRAKDLVRQILTFSRQTEQKCIAMSPAPVIKEALKLLRASLPSTVQISENIEQNTRHIVADPTQLHQIIMNLAVNAAWAMKDGGGKLAVELSEEVLNEESASHGELPVGTYIRLTVSDSGCGMDEKTLSRIFEPFFTTKGLGEGTGLGLPVVHGIVRSCGGDVFVTSTQNVGTQFDLYFPSVSKEAYQKVSSGKLDVSGNESIILVDDEKLVGTSTAQSLARFGYKVTTFTNAVVALQELRTNPAKYDLLITDFTMPQITGAQLAQMAKQIRSDLPVIVMTGFSTTLTVENAAEFGVDELAFKPLIGVELATTVRRVLRTAASTHLAS